VNISKAVVVRVVAKCSDLCSVTLLDSNNAPIAQHNGYVPDFMPGEHYGDYVELDIELATGKVLNWKELSRKDLQKPTDNTEWERV